MKILLTLIVILLGFGVSSAREINRQALPQNDKVFGQLGTITYPEAHFHIYVPDDFVFLNKRQTRHLFVDCWGNADDSRYFGALVSSQHRTFSDIDCAYFISYELCGYIPKATLRHFKAELRPFHLCGGENRSCDFNSKYQFHQSSFDRANKIFIILINCESK